MPSFHATSLVIAAALTLGACNTKHEVSFSTPEPITINVNLKLEVDETVKDLIQRERQLAMQSEDETKTRSSVIATEEDRLAAALERSEELKAQGLAGEDTIGTVSFVDPSAASAGGKTALATVNDARSDEYEAIAEARDIPVDQVQLIAGETRQEAEPAGRVILDAKGRPFTKS